MIISTPFPPQEGIGYYTYNLSKKLIENGHEITVFTRGSFKTQIENFEGINVIKAPFIRLYPFHVQIHGYFVNRLFKHMEKEFDLIHFHTPLPPIIKTSLPVVTTIHGSMLENIKDMEIVDLKSLGIKVLTKYISYPLVSKIIRISDVITTVSNPVCRELKKYYALNDAIIIENGVDEKKFIPADEKKGYYVLYVGRLSYGKGLFELLDAAKKTVNSNIKFYLVGKGELEKKLKERIIKEDLGAKVKLLGKLSHDELVEIYQNATIFLFLSYYEGFPTVVLEAMSSGLPVLVSDIEAHNNFIEDGKNGILVEKGSSDDVAKKIEILLNDVNLRTQLGNNARKSIEKKFTWDILSKKFEKIYEKLLNE